MTPDPGVIPFCRFNVIAERCRGKTQQEYGLPTGAWEAKNH